MHEGFNRIFWGMFFVTFHITIGGFEVLPVPSFVGFLMVRAGILQILRDPGVIRTEDANEAVVEEALEPPEVTGNSHKVKTEVQFYLKRAAIIALISAITAIPRVAAVWFNAFLGELPLASLFNLELNALLDLALAYYLLSGAVCLLRAQGDTIREAFYTKRLKTYLILLVAASVLGTAMMALGLTSGWTVILGLGVLALRIWFLAMLHGLKPKNVVEKGLRTNHSGAETE